MRAIGHRNKRLDRFYARRDRFNQRQKGQIEKQDLVFGVIGDPDHLIRMQPRIHRVQNAAGPRDRVVQLHMSVAVPRQRSDAIALLDTTRRQRIGHAARSLRKLSISRAMSIAFHAARDDFLLTVMAFSVGEQRRYQQWLLHHQSVHIASIRVKSYAGWATEADRSTST